MYSLVLHKVISEIIEENDWRDREFTRLKVNSSNVDEILWCRMSIPMIYAHWEGFVVNSLKILIEHLNSLSLNPLNASINLVVTGLGDNYKSLSGKQSFQQRITFTNNFHNLLKSSLKLSKKIDTKSNLKSSVLAEICEIFSFNMESFNPYTADIDRIVNIRNSIAHGENAYQVNMENITKYITSVTGAIDTLLVEIDEFIKQKKYLRPQQN